MFFSSTRLNYFEIVPADQADYMSMVMNAVVMKYITYHALTADDARLRFNKVIETNSRYPDLGYYSVRLKEGNAFLGVVKLIYATSDQAEVGYMLKPEFWGRHFASEMVNRTIEYARTIERIKELIAVVDPENAASIQVLKKCNFYLFKTEPIDNLPADFYKLDLDCNRE